MIGSVTCPATVSKNRILSCQPSPARNISTARKSIASSMESAILAEFFSRMAALFYELVVDLECPTHGLRMMELVA